MSEWDGDSSLSGVWIDLVLEVICQLVLADLGVRSAECGLGWQLDQSI